MADVFKKSFKEGFYIANAFYIHKNENQSYPPFFKQRYSVIKSLRGDQRVYVINLTDN